MCIDLGSGADAAHLRFVPVLRLYFNDITEMGGRPTFCSREARAGDHAPSTTGKSAQRIVALQHGSEQIARRRARAPRFARLGDRHLSDASRDGIVSYER